jgi:spore germination protein GerM
MNRRVAVIVAVFVLTAGLGWLLFVALPRWYGPKPVNSAAAAAAPATPAAAPAVRKITATLYYVNDEGMALVPAQREVLYGATVADQARAIIDAQIASTEQLISAIPAGTKIRQVFITEQGDAFVDLSADAVSQHPGGAVDEILTVYTIVDALTVNLPAVKRVQILVDGKEVDTLAGHVDLRHPLAKSLEWVVHDTQ